MSDEVPRNMREYLEFTMQDIEQYLPNKGDDYSERCIFLAGAAAACRLILDGNGIESTSDQVHVLVKEMSKKFVDKSRKLFTN